MATVTAPHPSASAHKLEAHVVAPSQRLASIDALRGFDMFWIIGGGPLVLAFAKAFVNPPPQWFVRQFDHVPWEGFVGWDLIMPLFLFVVGVSLPFSIGKRIAIGETRSQIYRKVASRVVILWILGMIAQGHLLNFDSHNLQFYSNTLQAIAAGYLISSIALVETQHPRSSHPRRRAAHPLRALPALHSRARRRRRPPHARRQHRYLY